MSHTPADPYSLMLPALSPHSDGLPPGLSSDRAARQLLRTLDGLGVSYHRLGADGHPDQKGPYLAVFDALVRLDTLSACLRYSVGEYPKGLPTYPLLREGTDPGLGLEFWALYHALEKAGPNGWGACFGVPLMPDRVLNLWVEALQDEWSRKQGAGSALPLRKAGRGMAIGDTCDRQPTGHRHE